MAAIALLIKLDSKGPVLFRQKRQGFNNELIEVLKFRSMYHHMADPTARPTPLVAGASCRPHDSTNSSSAMATTSVSA